MIICSCTGATDREIAAGGCKEAGQRCGGCLPAVRRILRESSIPCATCPGRCFGDYLTLVGLGICDSCAPHVTHSRGSGLVTAREWAVRWCIEVRECMDAWRLGVRGATRWLHAELIGLEVDWIDLRYNEED